MYLILIITLFLNYFGTDCKPVESFYKSLQDSENNPELLCSELRKSILFTPEPDYLANCFKVGYQKDDSLCKLYTNNFLYLCKAVTPLSSSDNLNPLLSDNSVRDSFSKPFGSVCGLFESNPYYYDGFENLQSSVNGSCMTSCFDSTYKFKPICSAIVFMVNATTNLNNVLNTKTKPHFTVVDNKKDNSAHSLNVKPVVDNAATLQKTTEGKAVFAPQTAEVNPPLVSNSANIPVQKLPSQEKNEQVKVTPKSQEAAHNVKPVKKDDEVEHREGMPEAKETVNQPLKKETEQSSNLITPEGSDQAGSEPVKNDATSPKDVSPIGSDLQQRTSAEKEQKVNNPPQVKDHELGNNQNPFKDPKVETTVEDTVFGSQEKQKEKIDVNAGDDKKSSVPLDVKQENTITQPEKPVVQQNKNEVGDGDDYNNANLDDTNEDIEIEGDIEMPPKEVPKTSEVKTTVVENSKPHQIIEDDVSLSANYQNQSIDDSDSYFFSYFMMVCIMFICGYVAYHNKQKILALVVEGRQGRRNSRTRRPNSANYRKLDSNLEEAVTSSCTKNTTQIIY